MLMRVAVVVFCFAVALVPSLAQSQDYLWCYNADTVNFSYDPATGVLAVEHKGAMYNCCPEPAVFEVETGPGIITITEIVTEEAPCDCNCCFELRTSVEDIPPGLWTVRYTWLDLETGQWSVEEIQLEVTGPRAGAKAAILDSWMSDCLDLTAVPEEPEPESQAWDVLKSWYLHSR